MKSQSIYLGSVLLPVSGVVQLFGLVFGLLVWLWGSGVGVVTLVVAVLVTLAVGGWGLLTMKAVSPMFDVGRDVSLWLLGPCLGFGLLSLFVVRVVLPRGVFLVVFVLVPVVYGLRKGLRWFGRSGRVGLEPFGRQEPLVFGFVVTGIAGLSLASGWSWSMPVTFVALVAVSLLTLLRLGKPLVGWLLVVPLLLVVWRMSVVRPETWWLRAAGIPTDESHMEAYANGLVEFGPLVNPLWRGYDGLTATAYHHLSYLFVGIINALASAQPYTVQELVAPAVFAVSLVASLLLFLRHIVSRLTTPPQLNVLTIGGLLSCMVFLRIEGAPSNTIAPAVLLASFVVIAKANEVPASWRNATLVGVSVIVMVFAKGPLAVGTVGAAAIYALFDLRARWKGAAAAMSALVVSIAYLAPIGPADTLLRFEFWARETMYSEFGISLYHLKLFITLIVLPFIVGLTCMIIALFNKHLAPRHWITALSVVTLGGALSQVLLSSNADRGHRYFAVSGYISSGLLLLMLGFTMSEKTRVKSAGHLAVVTLSIGTYWFFDISTRTTDSKLIQPLPLVSAIAIAIAAIGASLHRGRSTSHHGFRSAAGILATLFLTTGLLVDTVKADWKNFGSIPTTNSIRSFGSYYGDAYTKEVITFLRQSTTTSDLLAISTCDLALLAKDYCEPDYRIPALTERKFLAADARFSAIDSRNRPDIELSGPLRVGQASEVVAKLRERGVTHLILKKPRVQDRGIEAKREFREDVLFENGVFIVLKLADRAT